MENQIVISGISGRFPQSNNLEEFWSNLINGVDMVTTDQKRWPIGYLGLPERKGTLKADLTHFDANFFGIFSEYISERVDPQIRQLLEVTFEAIVDAGINPAEIRGSNTGVFVGASAHDTYEACRRHPDLASGYDITGSACCMLANRVSFAFDLRGPSFCIDTFCSSSLMALHQGMAAIRAGECDAAIIAGVNLLLNPMTSLQIQRLGGLSMDGKCKSFDASGDGFVRSEAIVALFIQKSDIARRSYCTLLHSKTNTDGFKTRGVSYPAGPIQQKLMEETYAEAGINPNDVFYVEPHGTGTAAGDPEEVNAITNVFTKNRNMENQLLIGSSKSNMGHAEPAAALCAVAKIVLSLREGIIPANLYFANPNPNIPSLMDGRIQVVTENTPLNGDIIGVNSTGLGGSNIHVIIRANQTGNIPYSRMSKIPTLIPVSGRTYDAVNYALERIIQHTNNPDFAVLLHKIAEHTVPLHHYRGYAIFENKSASPKTLVEIAQTGFLENPFPLWFIFSGMGTLWSGMMNDLLEFKIFAESIEKSSEILKSFNLDLYDIMINGTTELLDKHMGICFIAMGIAFTNLLDAIGLKPDGFIGHSAGEMLCAYLDGCISHEEALISYYWKDLAVLKCSGGAMAAIGLSWDEALARCPVGIYLACHNSENNVTISGPEQAVREFVDKMKSEGIFAREVSTGGIAYHSPYLVPILDKLKKNVKAIAKNPKERSSAWISTSIPEEDWSNPNLQSLKTGSGDYVINNIKSPVLFYGALKHIPPNAVVLEISAHSLFVSMLRKALPESCQVLGLIRKGNGNNGVQLLSAIGKLYQLGFNPKLAALYDSVEFPVPAETPMIAPLVQWDHTIAYPLPDYLYNGNSTQSVVIISLENQDYEYLSGHVIDGRNIFPATCYLDLVWRKFANLNGIPKGKCPVEFENIQFERAAIIPKNGPMKLEITLDYKTGLFEICEGGSTLVTGIIRCCQKFPKPSSVDHVLKESKFLPLSSDDFYKALRIQGYEYSGLFKGVKMADNEGKWAKIVWEENWVTFLDNMLQFSILSKTTQDLFIPTRIQKICIDPIVFGRVLENSEYCKEGIFISYSALTETLNCQGIQMNGLKTTRTPRKQKNQNVPILEEMNFIPYFDYESLLSKENAIKILIDLVIENTSNSKLHFLERTDHLVESISSIVFAAVHTQPLKQVEITIVSDDSENNELKRCLLEFGCTIIVSKSKLAIAKSPVTQNMIILNTESEFTNEIQDSLTNGGFVLLHSDALDLTFKELRHGLILVSEVRCPDHVFGLYRKPKVHSLTQPQLIAIKNGEYDDWLPKIQEAMKQSENNFRRIYIVSNEMNSGIVGFFHCLRQEPGGQRFRCIFAKNQDQFDIADHINLDHQIFRNDLTINVISESGTIGSYRHLPLYLKSLETRKSLTAFVNIENVGDLSSLRFIEAHSKIAIPENQDQKFCICKVFYSALNFRDVMLATGRLPQESLPGRLATDECVLGLEFSGTDKNSNRIMGMVESRGMATHIMADPMFLWEIPANWTMEDAATVPVAYSTAYYALIVRGRMRSGESILIHSGSGAVGQAALSIGLSMNCTIFITVGSTEKKKFLMDRFPQLKDECFSNSRDISFEDQIIVQTQGRGVDLILNSLSEEKLQASLRCLAVGGRFLEIGKFDLSRNNTLGMNIFLKNVTFHGILLDSLFGKDTEEKREVVQLLKEGIVSGTVTPLKRTVFENNQIEDAFRFIASGKHIGKVLLKIRSENPTKAKDTLIDSKVRTYFDPAKVYIIIGGLGGFGLELTNWMIQRNAKKLVLVSRTGIRNGYQNLLFRRWLEAGVELYINHEDITDLGKVEALINMAQTNGPIGGIFNLAMVLKDGEIVNQTSQDFNDVIKPKIDGTTFLDIASRKLCSELDHFVVFSSAACGRGNSGQTNYGFANSGMERICEMRKADKLPALAIQWAAIGDVGVVHEMFDSNDVILCGTIPQRLSSCLNTLDMFLRSEKLTVVSSMVLPIESIGSGLAAGKGTEKPTLLVSVAKILGLKSGCGTKVNSSRNANKTLGDLGVDSLMVVEIRQLLERCCDAIFSTSEIRELTWAKLEDLEKSARNA